MATGTRKRQGQHQDVTVLHGVSYRAYARMTRLPANAHLRMAYHDGTLEIASPRPRQHERPSDRIFLIIMAFADAFGLTYDSSGSFTFQRGGDGPFKGVGKEPDLSFYFASVDRMPRDRDPDLELGDPPPDLWVEVENRATSVRRLPVYASLGVPEVWRYRAKLKKMIFLQLVDGSYQQFEQSLCLPMVRPVLIEELLALGEDLPLSQWTTLMRARVALLVESWNGGAAGPI